MSVEVTFGAQSIDRVVQDMRGQCGSWLACDGLTSVSLLITPMIALENLLPHRRNLPLDQRLERPQQRLE